MRDRCLEFPRPRELDDPRSATGGAAVWTRLADHGVAPKTRRGPSLCRTLLVALGIGVGLFLAACAGSAPPVSFESLCGGLHPEQFGTMDRDAAYAWFDQQKAAPPDQGNPWQLELLEGRLLRILTHRGTPGPTFGEVVDSLGAPTSVYWWWRDEEVPVYVIGLDYPTVGVFLRGQVSAPDDAGVVLLSRSMRVDYVECFGPHASMEEVLRKVGRYPEEFIRDELLRRAPWPGFGGTVTFAYP